MCRTAPKLDLGQFAVWHNISVNAANRAYTCASHPRSFLPPFRFVHIPIEESFEDVRRGFDFAILRVLARIPTRHVALYIVFYDASLMSAVDDLDGSDELPGIGAAFHLQRRTFRAEPDIGTGVGALRRFDPGAAIAVTSMVIWRRTFKFDIA